MTYELTQIATSTAPAIKTADGKVLTIDEAVCEMLNKLDKIEKGLV